MGAKKLQTSLYKDELFNTGRDWQGMCAVTNGF